MASFTAFYDADVLYGSQLRNLLMHLAVTGLYRARWSESVHEEWTTRLFANRPDLTREKLERTRMMMDKHAEDALVIGYEDLIEGLHLPDPNDRHVLAAAIRGRADVIVTRNVKDLATTNFCQVINCASIRPIPARADFSPGLLQHSS